MHAHTTEQRNSQERESLYSKCWQPPSPWYQCVGGIGYDCGGYSDAPPNVGWARFDKDGYQINAPGDRIDVKWTFWSWSDTNAREGKIQVTYALPPHKKKGPTQPKQHHK